MARSRPSRCGAAWRGAAASLRGRAVLALVLAFSLTGTTTALAHPDGVPAVGDDEAPAVTQHGGTGGHLPAVQTNVALIGKGAVSVEGGAAPRGRVADVAAYGNHAFLTAFRTDTCLGGGFWVMDISDPTTPTQVAFMATTAGTYAGEGAQVLTPEFGPYAGRQLFLHQNETCPGNGAALAAAQKPAPHLGGFNIWDVTDAANPALLVEHAGDFLPGSPNPNTVHSVFGWNSHVDGKAYLVAVDNAELTDVDIFDITDPTSPVLVNDTLDLNALFGAAQQSPAGLTSVFAHDMTVNRVGSRYVMNVGYWDGGYVLLDVTDPTPGNVTLIAETDYALLDEERLQRAHEFRPEGNAHQSELSPDFRYLIGTDEDFGPYKVVATITGGPAQGTEFSAVSGSATPPVDENTSIVGVPTFVGLACVPLPAGSGIALIERGTCNFQDKLNNITAAGYSAGLVFNSVRPDCQSLVRMAATGTLPFLFVSRQTGLQLLGITGGDPCTTPAPAAGSPAHSLRVQAVFDGWGYVRLFRTKIPGEVGTTGSITQLDTYSIPEAQDAAFARGFGDLSVHEVAMDPRRGSQLAYLSYYAGGLRVVEYGERGLTEVGSFIDEGGSNFWGVEVHSLNGQYYVLASDRDFGLYIFQYTGSIPGGPRGESGGRP